MGNYNPYAPQIVGQEWVPIRDQGLTLNPVANTLERGYSFSLPTTTTVDNIRFYLPDFPPFFGSSMIFTASIYPRGRERDSGPIRSVVIPCNYGQITGGTPGQGPFIGFTGLTVADCLYNRSDNYFISWTMGQSGVPIRWGMDMYFATNAYAQLLNGKRILGVDFLSNMSIISQGFEVDTIGQSITTFVRNDFDPTASDTFRLPNLLSNQTPVSTVAAIRMHLGDANRFFGVSTTTNGVNQIMQWTYPQLQRFEASSANRLHLAYEETPGAATLGPQFQVDYAALEVFYCEESRVAFGSRIFNDDIPNRPSRDPFILGMNYITVRDAITYATGPSLPAGNYTLTISESNMGDNYYAAQYRSTATMNQVRQLYPLPSHPGVQINMPFPLDESIIGETFTSEETDLVPQLTMHDSSGTLITTSHVYGQQSAGEVWGTNTVTQEIDDRLVGGLRQYPWISFYARRFGDTTIPLKVDMASPSVSGGLAAFTVQITPAEWDALDEIADRWKKVTLQFPTPVPMGVGIIPQFRWSATTEKASSRWEVLGATAPAVSGIPQQMDINLQFGQVPAGQRLYLGTYGVPTSGAVINEGWLPQWGPYVSGTADDQASDVSVIFSQFMPLVTGFSVSVQSQALTGIGLNCGIAPCGIPTHLLYNRLTWGLPANTGIAVDQFSRSVTNGFGSPDTGGTYQLTAAASSYQVNGLVGLITAPVAGPETLAFINSGTGPDFDIVVSVAVSGAAVGGTVRGSVMGRLTDANNFYQALVQTDAAGATIVGLIKTVGGGITVITTQNILTTINNNNWVNIRFAGYGPYLKIKTWSIFAPEPAMWQIQETDTALTTGNGWGLSSRNSAGATGTVMFDNLTVKPPSYWFDYLELQRSDDITDWATIMKATSPATTGFNDYEARIGINTNYRIRGVGQYGFPGPWSSTVTASIISPGVSGSCLSNSHIMTFTTNERQNGSSNLAYSNAWEGEVTESFSFPEAGFTQLQPMYDRDFFVAFRPLERGGDQFSRDLLVQAAAISPETLADFRSLRDMAWADVSYICLRDEDGNRWFASVNVPAGVVKNQRRLYLASLQVVEVTDTPSPVDP